MSARLAALVCLAIVGPCFGRSEPVLPTARPLVVYLKGDAFSKSVEWMKQEVGGLMRDAGFDVEFRGMSAAQSDAAQVAVLNLTGSCDSGYLALIERPAAGTKLSLASTAVSDGQVLPFSELHCDAVSQVLLPYLVRLGDSDREKVYGRALGRVTAHELYHVLARETAHVTKGVAKPCFSAEDLLSSSFVFEPVAVQRMHHHHPGLTRVRSVAAALRHR